MRSWKGKPWSPELLGGPKLKKGPDLKKGGPQTHIHTTRRVKPYFDLSTLNCPKLHLKMHLKPFI